MTPGKKSHRPKKRLGQNFLQDTNIISKIMRYFAAHANDCVLEIGPGQGALTLALLPEVAQLISVEVDADLIQPLVAKTEAFKEKFILHQADALQVALMELPLSAAKCRVIGNLPYNISTPLLFHLLSQSNKIIDMTFMLQKEVVERITATPGSKQYGRLSVMVQYYCQTSKLFDVSPHSFFPAPKVMSSVFQLRPYTAKPLVAVDESHFQEVVRQAFSQRRKTLGNAMKSLLQGHRLSDFGCDEKRRAENLSVADFVELSNKLCVVPE